MTRRVKVIILLIMVALGVVGLSIPFWYLPKGRTVAANGDPGLIRFHVIANSDSEKDQALKRKIRDLIVEEMTPAFAGINNLEEARTAVRLNLSRMEEIARAEIAREGFDYNVKAMLGRFWFPVKNYGDFTLPAGEYEAVRVVIGEGQGANWWCVLFPPVCFQDVSMVAENIAAEESQPVFRTDDSKAEQWTKGKVANKNAGEMKTDNSPQKIKIKFKLVELMQKSHIKLIRELGENLAEKQ